MRRLAALSLVAGLIATPGGLRAQGVLQIERVGGFVGLRMLQTRTSAGKTVTGQESFRVNLRGALLDPGLLQFDLGLWPTFSQSRVSTTFRADGSDGRVLGAEVQARLLQARAVSGRVRYFRQATEFWGRGGRRGMDHFGRRSTFNANLTYANALMPLEVQYQRQSLVRLVFDGVREVEVPERFEAWRFSGFNRKTRFRLEQRGGGRFPLDNTIRLGTIQNQQRWGKGSTFNTRLNGQQRTGSSLAAATSWDYALRLRLQHPAGVSSNWTVTGLNGRANGTLYNSRGLAGGLSWGIVDGLSVGVGASRYRSSRGPVRQRVFRLEPRAGLSLRLPFGVRLSLGGAIGYEEFSQAREGDGAYISVVRETHRVDETGTFLLDNPDADIASVVLSGENGEIYVVDLDYVVVPAGNLLEVIVPPGSRIAEGSVFVDYRYRALGAADGAFLTANYSGDVTYRWVRAYHRRYLRDPEGPGGAGRIDPLRYFNQTATGAQLTVPLRSLTATVRAEHQARVDNGFELRSTTASSAVSVRMTNRIGASVGGSFRRSQGSSGRGEVYAGTLGLKWNPSGLLSASGDLSLWRSVEGTRARRTQLGVNAQLRWVPGLLEVDLLYRFRDWRTERLDTGDVRGMPTHSAALQVGRSF